MTAVTVPREVTGIQPWRVLRRIYLRPLPLCSRRPVPRRQRLRPLRPPTRIWRLTIKTCPLIYEPLPMRIDNIVKKRVYHCPLSLIHLQVCVTIMKNVTRHRLVAYLVRCNEIISLHAYCSIASLSNYSLTTHNGEKILLYEVACSSVDRRITLNTCAQLYELIIALYKIPYFRDCGDDTEFYGRLTFKWIYICETISFDTLRNPIDVCVTDIAVTYEAHEWFLKSNGKIFSYSVVNFTNVLKKTQG